MLSCSDNVVPAHRLRMPAVTYAAICDLFIISAHLTELECCPLPEGSRYEGVDYCATSHFLTLGLNGKTLFFFVLRVYYEKNRSRAEPLVPRFRSDLSFC